MFIKLYQKWRHKKTNFLQITQKGKNIPNGLTKRAGQPGADVGRYHAAGAGGVVSFSKISSGKLPAFVL